MMPTPSDPDHAARLQPFVGAWIFDPARSDYGDTPLAVEGLYAMVPSGQGLACEVLFTTAEGERRAARYDLVPDGAPHPLPGAEIVSVRGTWDGDALVSEVLVGDVVAERTRRTLDGDTLTLVQQDLTTGARTVGCYTRSRVKQVILYRRDLTMRKGKIAAQVAHASMKAVLMFDRGAGQRLQMMVPGPVAVWLRTGVAKVVLSVADEADLVKAYEAGRAAGIPAALITDSGRTEFGGVPTRTTVALGPWTADAIDRISGPEGLVATKLA
ncbi:MAG: aminoacyl-tRNA hydrolase [Deltaproteobacteria bacterium]|nr:MAG: aminoacyl-tRNA hydrolase [Deltaproteobacteria bacterium]